MRKSVVTKEKSELIDQLKEQISFSWLARGRAKRTLEVGVLWALVGGIRYSQTLMRRGSNP